MMAPAVSIKTESIVSSSSSSSVSSLSSASGNSSLTLTKAELDRMIAENMASVLKSLRKRKHAKKHARIRQAAAAPEEDGANVDERKTMAEKGIEGTKENGNTPAGKKDSNIVRRRISPRKNNQANTSSGGSRKVSKKHGLKELQPKTKEESSDHAQSNNENGSDQRPQAAEKNGKENKTVNAFHLMMSARSKSIGSNSPGKDMEAVDTDMSQPSLRDEKVKRKLKLQEWAERKCSRKRKMQEDAEDEYIQHQLNKRAKRLKKLIGNMKTEDEEVQEVCTPEAQATPQQHKESVRKRNKTASTSSSRRSALPKHPPSGAKNEFFFEVEKGNDEIIKIEDVSNDEFLEKLSSPRKKKDSLLGYFAKVSPDVNNPDASSRRIEPSVDAKLTGSIGGESQVSTSPSEISSRPRRSCANRIKDYAAFERYSAEKVEQKTGSKNNSAIVTPLKIINVQSPNTMKVVKSPSLHMFRSSDTSTAGVSVAKGNAETPTTGWPTTPRSVKLAPVFSRGKQQQPAVDPEKARARQLFLMSGIPEKMRQEMEKRAAYEDLVLNESPVFPLVSHITQLDETPSSGSQSRDFGRSCIRLKPEQIESPSSRGTWKGGKMRKIRYGLFTECNVDDYEAALIKCIEMDDVVETGFNDCLPEIENVKEIVRDYKRRYHHFPVFKCYKQFRTIYQDYQQEQSEESVAEEATSNKAPFVDVQRPPSRIGGKGLDRKQSSDTLDSSIEIVEPTYDFRNGELLFTEKYKPQHTEQILINYVPAKLLKRFLSLWQVDGSGGPRRTNGGGGAIGQILGDYFTMSSDEHNDFENSNESTAPSGEICNHVVLVGPPGCGKTCNVYAVAKEMNFNVLEINASSRRKGKIILQELLEATQSHQVRQKSERSNSTDSLLPRQKNGVGAGSKKGGLMNGVFSCLERRPSFSETNGNGSKKLSLILIEDADIVFEQDDGFLGAINQLVATSKRPIVLTTSNPSCAHMARYMARNNVIRYVAPGIGNVAKFLSVLALVERIPIDQHDLGRLYAHNGKDMRKTLNDLQFFIQSGGDMALTTIEGADEPYGEVCDTDMNEAGVEMDNESSLQLSNRSGARKDTKDETSVSKQCQHTTLYQLFSRNQNVDMVLRLPLAFDTLWCNMELVLREAKAVAAPISQPKAAPVSKKKPGVSTPKSKRRTNNLPQKVLTPEEKLWDDLGFLYESISRAEMSWGVTQRNRIRYGRDLQDEQQQQQLANEMGHALVEGSWIDWFDRRQTANGAGKSSKEADDNGADDTEDGAKEYDGLRKLEQEQRTTIASYIGVNGIRSRVTACDYEPLLRQICRTERDRSSQERRGSRFYHYLRNFAFVSGSGASSFANGATATTNSVSVDHFDALSQRFEEQRSSAETTDEKQET